MAHSANIDHAYLQIAYFLRPLFNHIHHLIGGGEQAYYLETIVKMQVSSEGTCKLLFRIRYELQLTLNHVLIHRALHAGEAYMMYFHPELKISINDL